MLCEGRAPRINSHRSYTPCFVQQVFLGHTFSLGNLSAAMLTAPCAPISRYRSWHGVVDSIHSEWETPTPEQLRLIKMCLRYASIAAWLAAALPRTSDAGLTAPSAGRD
jgi:hypothetical protein